MQVAIGQAQWRHCSGKNGRCRRAGRGKCPVGSKNRIALALKVHWESYS